MIVINRVWTRTGDDGRTRLSDLSSTAKSDPRVAAYGEVDEANATLGLALTTDDCPDDIAAVLQIIQAELFDLGADLSNPLADDAGHDRSAPEPLRILDRSVTRLEQWCDRFGEGLEPLRTFVLPGGTRTAAALHLSRTVVRRAERAAWVATETYGTDSPGGISPIALRYLNRLSDLLFVMARHANRQVGDSLWQPGAARPDTEPTRPDS